MLQDTSILDSTSTSYNNPMSSVFFTVCNQSSCDITLLPTVSDFFSISPYEMHLTSNITFFT